jgi:hypothetical protein
MAAAANTVVAGNGTELIRYDWNLLITEAFDLLFEHPEGVTLVSLVDRLEVPEHIARKTINMLREHLADDHDTNIIAVPNGRERRYQLVAEHGLETAGWLGFNQKYVETRLRTVKQVYATLSRAAQTEKERDQAARILRAVTRLMEDVADMQKT